MELEVVRSKGDYVVGRVGKISGIDFLGKRARVDWEGENRTWVSFDAIEPTAIPYSILPAKDVNGMRKGWPKYERKF